MAFSKWLVAIALSLPVSAPAHAAPSARAAYVCDYGRSIAPVLTAAILGDAWQASRHRHNPLAVVKRAERRIGLSGVMQGLLAHCGSKSLTPAQLRWMSGVVDVALENAVIGQNAPSGAQLELLRRLIDDAISA